MSEEKSHLREISRHMKNSKIVKRIVILALMGLTLLLFFLLLSISHLKQSHLVIDSKYKKELEALATIGAGWTNEPTQNSMLERDRLRTLFSSSDFYCVGWWYGRNHAGGFLKGLPSESVQSYQFIYSENDKGDRLYYAKSSDGVRLYYYRIHLPDAKVAKYFTVMIRRDQVKK